MSEMRIAVRTRDLHAPHAVAVVFVGLDGLARDGLVKARPSAAGVKLRVRLEQRLPARRAAVPAWIVLGFVLAGEGPLGALLSKNVVLVRRELAPPFFFRLADFVRH